MPISKRKRVRSCINHQIYHFSSYKSLSPSYRAFVTSLTDIRIPNNIQEALEIPKWKTTIKDEIRALEKNGTWELAELPKEKNPIRSKWIFIVKYKANGSVELLRDLCSPTELTTKKPLSSCQIEHNLCSVIVSC